MPVNRPSLISCSGITALEGGLKGKERLGMPGNNPGARPGPTERKGSRKPRPHGFARQRMAPAHRVEHVLETCPDCGTGLAGGWTQRTREVIEVPVAPAEVTEHVFVARVCPVCERRRTPKADLGGVVRGQGRLGVQISPASLVPNTPAAEIPTHILLESEGSSTTLCRHRPPKPGSHWSLVG